MSKKGSRKIGKKQEKFQQTPDFYFKFRKKDNYFHKTFTNFLHEVYAANLQINKYIL